MSSTAVAVEDTAVAAAAGKDGRKERRMYLEPPPRLQRKHCIKKKVENRNADVPNNMYFEVTPDCQYSPAAHAEHVAHTVGEVKALAVPSQEDSRY